MLDRHQPIHFIGVGGIGMSALAGELAAAARTERCVIATDLLEFLPEAIRRCA